MVHLLLIAMFLALYAHDAYAVELEQARLAENNLSAALLTLGPIAGVGFFAWVWTSRRSLSLREHGRVVEIHAAQYGLAVSRVLATAWFGVGVLALGWLRAVRETIGDWVLLDEALAMLPVLVVFVIGWLAYAPIDRRLWEIALFRSLDRGSPAPTPRAPPQYAIDQFRHQAAIVLVPIGLIWAWNEALAMGAERLGIVIETGAQAGAFFAAQMVGVAGVFLLTPPLMTRIWSTVKLAPGDLRESLVGMLRRHGVRCREILVWRTHGTMINGAVMGLLAPLRFILLTDALLEQLPARQVEAVTAHEVAHIRRRHLPWLLASVLAGVGMGLEAVVLPAMAFDAAIGSAVFTGLLSPLVEGAAAVASLGTAALVFGAVSRAFERQADAFAAQSLSGYGREVADAASLRITPEAAGAMVGALQAVSDLNAVPTHRFSWRHGSIAERQRRLLALVGTPAARTPADRQAARLKVLTVVGLVLVGAIQTVELLGLWAPM